MEKKYFFFDYDGTLALPHTYNVPHDTMRTLENLAQNGHFLSLATGRLQADAINFLEKLPFNNAIADGGKSLTLNGKLVFSEPLKYNMALNCLEQIDAAGYKWAVIPENKLMRYTPFENFDANSSYYIPTTYNPNYRPSSFSAFYKIYVLVEAGAAQDALTESAMMRNIPWCSSTLNQIFIEPTEKAEGIKRAISLLGAQTKDVVVFGDGNNDMSMFSPEWINIAMGNATQPLKDAATYITDAVDAGGIYNACKHFGWI